MQILLPQLKGRHLLYDEGFGEVVFYEAAQIAAVVQRCLPRALWEAIQADGLAMEARDNRSACGGHPVSGGNGQSAAWREKAARLANTLSTLSWRRRKLRHRKGEAHLRETVTWWLHDLDLMMKWDGVESPRFTVSCILKHV